MTGATAFTNMSRTSTVGGLLKEINQDRVLKQHEDY